MNQWPFYVIQKEPIAGYTPAEALKWFAAVSNEKTVAAVHAVVANHVGLLGHELDESDPWIEEAYDAWCDVENATYQRIWNILKVENDSDKANHTLSGIGAYYIVKPFMLRNGYRDGNGWWIENDEGESLLL